MLYSSTHRSQQRSRSMQDEEPENDCPLCDGTGEGQHDGQSCPACNGKGYFE